MKIGIFSDVHANLEALTIVMEAYKHLDIDDFICLGDVVGYGASPDECCNIVRPLVKFSVLGNHDAAVAGRMEYAYYYEACRFVLDLHSNAISKENMDWLKSIKYTETMDIDGVSIGFSHGAPVIPENFDYVFSMEQAYKLLPHFDELKDVNFIGHSHLCRAFALEKDDVHEVISQDFVIRPGMKYIIGVGSTGQPRDYDNRAAYTVFDTIERKFTYYRAEYDIEKAALKIFNARIDRNFGNRLFVGV
ncbi:metallophosphatase family protein [Myxococcota bacterium]|nr:metallophosphatase family protein [Myxococcota bacterium]MBU1380495.1 metallophosphatase family protein [Myxococcota bacterium]MBU1497267.1 metallophosphatase family protein [Myxococcota bacterium]